MWNDERGTNDEEKKRVGGNSTKGRRFGVASERRKMRETNALYLRDACKSKILSMDGVEIEEGSTRQRQSPWTFGHAAEHVLVESFLDGTRRLTPGQA